MRGVGAVMGKRRVALVAASTGGHLEQACRLRDRFEPAFDEIDFVTFKDKQSVSLLSGEQVHYVRHIWPRDWQGIARAARPAVEITGSGRYTDVISTGAAIAIPFLAAGWLSGCRLHYIESAARAQGPSLSGKVVSKLPGVRLYRQYPDWPRHEWLFRGSVFDGFVHGVAAPNPPPLRRIVVTLGTMRDYPFRRAIEAVVRILPEISDAQTQVLWQVGGTPVDDLGIEAEEFVPAERLKAAISQADLVIAHAGIGSCLQILDSGRAPILLARSRHHGEHVDDHQRMIAAELDRRGLAVTRDPERLSVEDVVEALRLSPRRGVPDPFLLAV